MHVYHVELIGPDDRVIAFARYAKNPDDAVSDSFIESYILSGWMLHYVGVYVPQ